MKYTDALKYAEEFKQPFDPLAHRIEIAGSTRRKKPDNIKDIELVMIPRPDKLYELKNLFNSLNVTKGHYPDQCGIIQIATSHCKVDMFITKPECWGCIYLIRTGPAEYCKRLMKHAVMLNMRFHEGRLWKLDHSRRLHSPIYTPQEQDVFRELGMDFIEPENRK